MTSTIFPLSTPLSTLFLKPQVGTMDIYSHAWISCTIRYGIYSLIRRVFPCIFRSKSRGLSYLVISTHNSVQDLRMTHLIEVRGAWLSQGHVKILSLFDNLISIIILFKLDSYKQEIFEIIIRLKAQLQHPPPLFNNTKHILIPLY